MFWRSGFCLYYQQISYFCIMNAIQNHNYIQVSWKATAEIQEIIMTIVADLGFESFEQNEQYLYAYIPANAFSEKLMQEVLSEYPVVENIPYETKYIPAENWNAVWESHFTPVSLYPDVLIRAEHHSNSEDVKYTHVIQIQPKMAFGTGHHETTQMMLKAMKQIDFQNKTVLDVGCGSGILSIYAHFLGARQITATDIDTWCIENTQENALLNKVNNITTHLGSIETLSENNFDVILANINRNVILSQMKAYYSKLNQSGFLILSGFLVTDKSLLQNCAHELNLGLIHEFNIKDWLCMIFQK